jgi:hypothetical protein
MRALDAALYDELVAALPDGIPVYRAAAPRDDPPPYVLYRQSGSQRGAIGAAGFGGAGVASEARQYEFIVLAVSRDPEQAEDLREAITQILQWRRLAPAGWTNTTPFSWLAEVDDPGEMLPGGADVEFAGDRWTVDIYRQRA